MKIEMNSMQGLQPDDICSTIFTDERMCIKVYKMQEEIQNKNET